MECNESANDRLVRAVLGAGLLGLAFLVRRGLGVALGVVAGLLLLSAYTGSCHVYEVLGLSTAPKPRALAPVVGEPGGSAR